MLLRRLSSLFGFAVLAMLAGCALNVSTIPVDAGAAAYENPPRAEKTVHIRQVDDDRFFDPQTRNASVPSTEPEDEAARDRSIGRKRNSFGKALGSIELPKEQGVRALVREAVEKAFAENGYRIVDSPSGTDATIVDVSIRKFWAWMQPGFWMIRLNADIAADIEADGRKLSAGIRYGEHFQTGLERNYQQVLNRTYAQFISAMRKKIAESEPMSAPPPSSAADQPSAAAQKSPNPK